MSSTLTSLPGTLLDNGQKGFNIATTQSAHAWNKVKNDLMMCTVAMLIVATIFFILAGHYGCKNGCFDLARVEMDSFNAGQSNRLSKYGNYNAGSSGPIMIGTDFRELSKGAASYTSMNDNPKYSDCTSAGDSEEVIAEREAQRLLSGERIIGSALNPTFGSAA